ncbi:short-chain dehydrogenase, putative [Paecilomyces variotii No. 5]|uniref:Short-chain dehydrogenase, putative n=1 Tax=Byssochlamys spectabilis (strain No. 5 / NBRC 109023) TaxID=1356009 RepID=V5HQH8_BYSSN|nr:short-chain dehydrogenase, putative [Paecilomyces variotii No. 5]
MTDNPPSPTSPRSHFPSHSEPRVWVISSGDSPIGISLARQILAHGDHVVAGLVPQHRERDEIRRQQFQAFLEEVETHDDEGWRHRLKGIELDLRMMGECQAVIAEAVSRFGKVDILVCCTSQAVIGTVEELAASQRTLNLARDQFETNYFGPVNLMKAALPQLRKQKAGHIIVLSGITGHIGTPGLGVYCAAGWALEGFCDSIAYEIAPFNIKLSILQASIEIGILSNLVTSVPPIVPAYTPTQNHAPLFRGILNGILTRLSNETGEASARNEVSSGANGRGPLSEPNVVSMYPPLTPSHLDILTAETVHAITAIAGHENPPSRHIIGQEGVASVKEKLKTVSEELEDFIQASCAADIAVDDESASSLKEDSVGRVHI